MDPRCEVSVDRDGADEGFRCALRGVDEVDVGGLAARRIDGEGEERVLQDLREAVDGTAAEELHVGSEPAQAETAGVSLLGDDGTERKDSPEDGGRGNRTRPVCCGCSNVEIRGASGCGVGHLLLLERGPSPHAGLDGWGSRLGLVEFGFRAAGLRRHNRGGDNHSDERQGNQ
jgi:hypothetical protein